MPSNEQMIKEAVDSIQNKWDAFKKENDERLAKVEKNRGTGDYEEKLTKLNEALDAKTKEIETIKAAMDRFNAGGTDDVTTTDAKTKEIASKAMNKFMKGARLTEEECKAVNAEYGQEYQEMKEHKALSVNSDPDGGYFVRPQVASYIKAKMFETSPMRQLANVETISSESLEIPYDNDEVAANWVGESQSRSETNSGSVAMIKIVAHEIEAAPQATQKFLDDAAINVEQWHQNKVIAKFNRTENAAFVAGNGVTQPKGILAYASGTDFNQLQQVASGTSATFTANGLIDTQNALFEDFQMNAVWMMARASASAIRKLVSGDGSYLWNFDPKGGLNGAPMQVLLGKPVHFAADMQAIGASSLSAAYGDFKAGYTIVDRIGVRVLKDPYTARPFVKFITTKRVGGGVTQFQAIKLHVLST